MKRQNRRQGGFAILYVLLLMTGLLLMAGAAYALLCSLHEQTARDKQELNARASSFNAN